MSLCLCGEKSAWDFSIHYFEVDGLLRGRRPIFPHSDLVLRQPRPVSSPRVQRLRLSAAAKALVVGHGESGMRLLRWLWISSCGLILAVPQALADPLPTLVREASPSKSATTHRGDQREAKPVQELSIADLTAKVRGSTVVISVMKSIQPTSKG